MGKPVFGVSDQVQHKPGSHRRWLKEVDGLYYLCSENIGADQCGFSHYAAQLVSLIF